MEISINRGKDTLLKCPKPPMYLSKEAKEHYKFMGNLLATQERLKELHLKGLEIYAVNMAQFEFAIRSIEEKNRDKMGTGFIQKFTSGAQNISVEVTLRNNATDNLFKCFKIFGLDPKSEKELKSVGDPGQTDLFAQLMMMKNG